MKPLDNYSVYPSIKQTQKNIIMKKIVKIYQDSDLHESPREWDNLGTIAYKHSRYNIGEEQINDPIQWLINVMDIEENLYSNKHWHSLNNETDMLQYLEKRFSKDFVWLPVYLFDHSGITISTSPFGCRWDSGQIGYIYVSKEDVRKEYANLNKEWKQKYHKGKGIMQIAKSVLQGEIETFDQFIRGDVYGFKLFEEDTNGEEIETDSCWGFYGDDFENNGMKDHLPEEVHEQLKEIEVIYK